jgi:hypothetical protein
LPQKINEIGDIVGEFIDSSGVVRGFVRFVNGRFSAPIVDPNELPELTADIPEKLEQGKTTNLNSQSAKRWQKDGSLVAEIVTVSAGNKGTATATRTVVLGFDRSSEKWSRFADTPKARFLASEAWR